MKNVLITGSAGFIGKNLLFRLKERDSYNIFEYDTGNSDEELYEFLGKSDVVVHLAGVNRPANESEFREVNFGLTEKIRTCLSKTRKKPHIIFSSSVQAELNNPYGKSKKEAEEILEDLSRWTNVNVDILRLPNVFGKWCRPNYNSAVATFCNNIANDLEIVVHDGTKEVNLIYIDDVVDKVISLINSGGDGFRFIEAGPVYRISVGELADTLKSFRKLRETQFIPSFENALIKKLYSTFLSYLQPGKIAVPAVMKNDERGSLAELIKSEYFGQIFVSTTRSGITRGNHYHHTKTEKFIVIKGEAEINFRKIDEDKIFSIKVNGDDIKIVDIPPGYTHNIVNTGDGELIVLFWANEIFDQAKPDTNFLKV